MRSAGWIIGRNTALLGLLLVLAHTASAESESRSVQVTATILPRLELTVTPETGRDIAFGAVMQPATGDETMRTVKVNVGVFSNLGHPYHVTQTVRHPLTNTEGMPIADAQFQVLTSDATLGQLGAAQPTSIVPGAATTLYLSNDRGKSDSFNADYRLTVTPTTPAGDFVTDILYTVTSL